MAHPEHKKDSPPGFSQPGIVDPTQDFQKEEARRKQRLATLAKGSTGIFQQLARHDTTSALARALYTGVKLAQDKGDVFYNDIARPIDLVRALKELGATALTWTPETLCAVIDGRFGGWTKARVAQALDHFHTTGNLDTRIPDLVRQKLYALRIVVTSDSAHNFWENFEKIGCVFNDRLANFTTVQTLSAAECARTVAIIENIRPDQYASEVKIYIAACCHQDGLYTAKPSEWLHFFDPELQKFNEDSIGAKTDPKLEEAIEAKYLEYKKARGGSLEDSTESLQAVKLLGIDQYASEAIS